MRKVVPISECRDARRTERILRNLPPADTARWVASRKIAVVIAVENGVISEDEVCRRYDLSPEELDLWRRSLAKHGRNALHVTKLQHFRNTHEG